MKLSMAVIVLSVLSFACESRGLRAMPDAGDDDTLLTSDDALVPIAEAPAPSIVDALSEGRLLEPDTSVSELPLVEIDASLRVDPRAKLITAPEAARWVPPAVDSETIAAQARYLNALANEAPATPEAKRALKQRFFPL